MLKFPTKTLNTIKSRLLSEQKKVEENLKELKEEDPVNTSSLAESSEPGTDSYIADTHAKSLVLEDQLKSAGKRINIALTKIKNGTYGQCENCGRQIEIERLLAMSTAEYCLSCSKKKGSVS